MKSMLVRKCPTGAPFQGATILPGTPGEGEQRQVRNAGGQGVEYNVQCPADAFVSQVPPTPVLHGCTIMTSLLLFLSSGESDVWQRHRLGANAF